MTINGTEIDFSKQRGYFFNMDCLEALKQMPDKSVSLAIVDPPYGAGFTEGGGCQGWFSKYHQEPQEFKRSDKSRFGGRFDKYKDNKELGVHFHGRGRSKRYQEAYNDESSQICQVERERERETAKPWNRFGGRFDRYKSIEQGELGRAGTPKKSFRGTQPPEKSIFKSFSVSHGTRLSGGETTLNYLQQGVL